MKLLLPFVADNAITAPTKAKEYNSYTTPQAKYHSCSGTFVSDRAGVQPIG